MGSDNLLVTAGKGAIAGLVGTAVLSFAMPKSQDLLVKAGLIAPAPIVPKPNEEPPEIMAGKVAEAVFDAHPDKQQQAMAGQVLHWSYGTAWGVVYAVAQSRLRLPHLLHGSLLGGILTVLAMTAVPGLQLTPPPTEQPAPKNLVQASVLQLYGWSVALTFHLLGGDRH